MKRKEERRRRPLAFSRQFLFNFKIGEGKRTKRALGPGQQAAQQPLGTGNIRRPSTKLEIAWAFFLLRFQVWWSMVFPVEAVGWALGPGNLCLPSLVFSFPAAKPAEKTKGRLIPVSFYFLILNVKNKRKLGLGPGSSQSLQALRGLSLSLGNFGHRTSGGQGLPNSHILKKKEADAGCWLAAQQALGAANFFFLCKILGVRPSLRRQAGRPWNQDSAS